MPLPWQRGQVLSRAERTARRIKSDRLGILLISSASSLSTLKVMISCFWDMPVLLSYFVIPE